MISFFRFPTNVFIVDDDSFALNTMAEEIRQTGMVVKEFASAAGVSLPSKASYDEVISMFSSVSSDYYRSDTKIMRVYNGDVHKMIYHAKRFELVSLIIADYHLPKCNGLELFGKIDKSLPVKKILITGDVTSHALAIEAFNNGTIDGFINKTDMKNLQKISSHLIDEFFYDFCGHIFGQFSLIDDKKLDVFIEDFMDKKSLHEYYLLNENPSYLFLKNSKLSGLFIEKETNIVKFLKFMEEENLDPNIYQKIYERKYMPINAGNFDFDQEINIAECSKFEGDHNIYYYSYVTNETFFDINSKKIATFDNFNKKAL